ncbi:DUF3168 domain-containing protein [Rhodovulum adriaticum]|uniref:Uncharacterized protein DUF3168 n=1 Tax=Rhodovulum adriaticum TaxID=35804 RepID=A0A4V2SM06_RHOAD|nr:DUF3168 domain-containing protein [Rhodovulum adriaticum]MBK1636159.1 hypothetical protein [Rhodovulum adriaticum]TCP25476.1 uncharacterized protein DUF3168 [Rhodovulum adriaticum]
MSYGAAAALQAAIYQRLVGDAALGALVGEAIYDALPSGALPPTYVSVGPEEVRDASDGTGRGALHRFTVSVVTDAAGFEQAKAAAGAVSDALTGAALDLARGHLVRLDFERARARRVGARDRRRIDLRFAARVSDD